MDILKKYWGHIILLIIIICLIISGQIKKVKISELETQNNISNVLLDSISVYKNKLGELTSEKQAFNVKYSDLRKAYDRLDENSKKLVDRINALEKKNKIIQATTIRQEVIIDSLVNIKPIIDKPKETLTFSDSTKNLQYKIVLNQRQQSLIIQKIFMPNELYVSHSFIRDGISVKVTNSNEQYFKTNDINSYVIPLPEKKDSFKKQVKIFGIGIGVGAVGTFLLIK